mmetsp:Transcript_3904/g.7873  ORF Transcript_3904/g.7873 Transcript_3904/m.7873 type:complete len:223 (-) Transcript_3904:45-713(-)
MAMDGSLRRVVLPLLEVLKRGHGLGGLRHGAVLQASSILASQLVYARHTETTLYHLEGSRVLVPIYAARADDGQDLLPEHALSLACAAAVWRAGGIVVPFNADADGSDGVAAQAAVEIMKPRVIFRFGPIAAPLQGAAEQRGLIHFHPRKALEHATSTSWGTEVDPEFTAVLCRAPGGGEAKVSHQRLWNIANDNVQNAAAALPPAARRLAGLAAGAATADF